METLRSALGCEVNMKVVSDTFFASSYNENESCFSSEEKCCKHAAFNSSKIHLSVCLSMYVLTYLPTYLPLYFHVYIAEN